MIPSLPKLIALAAVLWAVWTGFRMLERRKADRKDSPPDKPEDRTGNGALDLEECKICRAWVAGEACEREACPYRR
ncbi:MAG: hypothetical protein VXY86_04195 [Pseudomonadota bacterium]|jgi:hypothetical protein|nr:hypothetical protein [Pseudomonadota bacterium]MEC8515716.1 hypothetical protein [Pseudomonadota bacterium]